MMWDAVTDDAMMQSLNMRGDRCRLVCTQACRRRRLSGQRSLNFHDLWRPVVSVDRCPAAGWEELETVWNAGSNSRTHFGKRPVSPVSKRQPIAGSQL